VCRAHPRGAVDQTLVQRLLLVGADVVDCANVLLVDPDQADRLAQLDEQRLPDLDLVRVRDRFEGHGQLVGGSWFGVGSVEISAASVAGSSAVVFGLIFSTVFCSARNSWLSGSGASFALLVMVQDCPASVPTFVPL
jgi:hypothetical protein